MKERMLQVFFEMFKSSLSEPVLVKSPGRINIIGEHTDYNEGFVLPAAIDKFIYVIVSRRDDHEIRLFSAGYNQSHILSIDTVAPSDKMWTNYILGVVDQLQKRGFLLSGFNLLIDGDVPLGAGLSSSAAVECATVFALNELFQLGLSKLDMVKMAQAAEHLFVGVKCGIMDMFASMFGKKDCVIRLDCRSLQYEYKPFLLGNYKILLLNSNVKHSLALSAYNKRREECEQGVAWVKESYPHVISLRDVSLQMLNECVLSKNKLVYRRCGFVVEEIGRLLEACTDLERGDIKAMGQKMFRTHEGLSKEYEVSCEELDFLVDTVKNNPAVAGARMMGGGFGGCTINLVEEPAVSRLVESLQDSYQQTFGKELDYHTVSIEDGTSLVQVHNSVSI